MNQLNFFSRIWLATLLLLLTKPPTAAQQIADTLPPLATIQARIDKATPDSLKLDQYKDITRKLMDIGRSQDATVLSRQALLLAQELDKKQLVALFLNRLGTIDMYDAKYPEAIKFFQRSFDVASSARDTNRMIIPLQRLGQCYLNTDEFALAEKYLVQALQLARLSQSEELAFCYNELSVLEGKRKNPKKAIEYGNQSMEISKKNNNMAEYYMTMTNNAICYKNLKQYKQAVSSYLEVLAYGLREKQLYSQIGVYVNLPWALIPLNRLEEAEHYAQLGVQLAQTESIANKDQFLEEAYNILTKINQQRGDYKAALDYREKAIAYHDSIFSTTKSQQLLELTTRYETEKKEAEIKDLNAQNERKQLQLISVGGGAILLLVGLGLVGRLYRRLGRANHQLADNNQQLNRTLDELRTTQTQLIQREKMASLGELTAGIAHEIQNPLNFVNNFSELSTELVTELKEEREKGEKRDEIVETDLLNDLTQNLQKITHHGQRASGIVRSMLEHSRMSDGERQLTDLNALTEEYLRLAYHGLRAKDKTFNADLTTNFDVTVGKVNIVSQDIGRVLLNLFNNAFYALIRRQKQQGEARVVSDYKPSINVSTKRQDGQVIIRVLDNGIGIADSVKAKIFQPFFTTKPTGEGTGLGLSLSYDIVTKGHSGTLTVASQEGAGSEFVITLPV